MFVIQLFAIKIKIYFKSIIARIEYRGKLLLYLKAHAEANYRPVPLSICAVFPQHRFVPEILVLLSFLNQSKDLHRI